MYGYDVKLHSMGRFQLGSSKVIGKVELLLISITPRLTLTQSGSTSYGFNYGLNNLLPCRYFLGTTDNCGWCQQEHTTNKNLLQFYENAT